MLNYNHDVSDAVTYFLGKNMSQSDNGNLLLPGLCKLNLNMIQNN